MGLRDNLIRRRTEREQKALASETERQRWDAAVERQLSDVQDKLKDLVGVDLLKIEPPEPGQLRISEPGGKTIAFKASTPAEHLIILEDESAPSRVRALSWDGSHWSVLSAAKIQSNHSDLSNRFDFNNAREYTVDTLEEALDVLLE